MTRMRLRVGLDGVFLSEPNTGSGQYSLQLWRHLVDDLGERGISLLRPTLPEAISPPTRETEAVDAPWFARSGKARKLWWEQRGVVQVAAQSSVELLHIPYFSAPWRCPMPLVVTVHDVIPLLVPQYAGGVFTRLYFKVVSATTRRARVVITDSECSRNDISRHLRVPLERITVVPLAAADVFRQEPRLDLIDRLRQRHGLSGPVIFNVGGFDVRKNLQALVEAFARSLPNLDPGTKLVISGRPHSANQLLYPPLEPIIQRLGVEGRVVLTGPVSEDEKVALYQLADLYVYPSLYEGFGLSPLEAMACGTPVVSSNLSSLPEVVGNGGLLVEPSARELSHAINAVMSDDALRRSLAERAVEQAARFSWERTAEMTAAVYRSALASTATTSGENGCSS